MLGSHLSAEPGAQFAMEALGVQPLFNLGMRLGEGTGCPIAFGIIEGAIYTMSNMASFSESGVDESDYIDIRETE